jgi:hypothetical protein
VSTQVGHERASFAASGGEILDPTLVLGVRADAVCLLWQTGDAPIDLRYPMMYLGQANGVLALYRPEPPDEAPERPTGPLRVPNSAVLILPAQDAFEAC